MENKGCEKENSAMVNQKWIKEVVPYIVARIKSGESEKDAVHGGINDYGKLVEELATQQTPRSKEVARLLCTQVFIAQHAKNALGDIHG